MVIKIQLNRLVSQRMNTPFHCWKIHFSSGSFYALFGVLKPAHLPPRLAKARNDNNGTVMALSELKHAMMCAASHKSAKTVQCRALRNSSTLPSEPWACRLSSYSNLSFSNAYLHSIHRYNKREEAQEAISSLNNVIPQGGNQPLIVRVAEEHGRAKAALLVPQYNSLVQNRGRMRMRNQPY